MKILLIFVLCLFLTGCSSGSRETGPGPSAAETTAPATEDTVPETTVPDPVEALLSSMSEEEKVGQLFLARCDASRAVEDVETYNLGGFVLFKGDFEGETPNSIREKLGAYQNAADIPLLLAVDEEGGTVSRVSRFPAFRDKVFPSPGMLWRKEGWAGLW